jgi:hypothetical protein
MPKNKQNPTRIPQSFFMEADLLGSFCGLNCLGPVSDFEREPRSGTDGVWMATVRRLVEWKCEVKPMHGHPAMRK